MVDPSYFFDRRRDNREAESYRQMMSDWERVIPLVITLSSGGRIKGPQAAALGQIYTRTPHYKMQEWVASKSQFNRDVADWYAGERQGLLEGVGDVHRLLAGDKPKRKPSAYNKMYKAEFKKAAPKFKKKNGEWKKNGFKNCVKHCHKCCKKRRKK